MTSGHVAYGILDYHLAMKAVLFSAAELLVVWCLLAVVARLLVPSVEPGTVGPFVIGFCIAGAVILGFVHRLRHRLREQNEQG